MPTFVRARARLSFEILERRTLLTTFYVDSQDGDDSSLGTSPADAWQSIARVNSQSFAPGDAVLFRREGSFSGQLDLNGRAGNAESPITVGAYGNGEAPIVERLFIRNGSDHVIVESLIIDYRKQSGDAVRIRDSANVVVRNVEIRNGTSDGIDFTNADGILFDGLHIHHFLAGSFTNQADAHGIVGADSDGVTIRNTEIHHVSGDSFQADADRDSDVTTNVLIEDSHFWTGPLEEDFNEQWRAGERPGENAIDTKVVTSNWDSVPRMQMVIRNVVAHGWIADSFINNKAAFNLKEKVDVLLDGITVYDNEIAFRLRGGRGNADVLMQNVVIYNNDKAIRAEDDLENLTVYNSTFGANNSQMLQFAGGDGGVDTWDFRNNAFIGELPSVASDPSNASATEDDFFDVANHDYRLTSASSLVDAGVLLASVQIDRIGAFRPQMLGQDVGAFEFAVDDSTPPSAPRELTATAVSREQLSLSWLPAEDAESGIQHYIVYRDGESIAEVAGLSYTDSGLDPDTRYTYEVSAQNGAGGESARSSAFQVTTLVDDSAPLAPADLTGLPMGTAQIDLAWSASTDPESGISGYIIYRDGKRIAQVAGTTFTDFVVQPGTTYVYTVAAINGDGLEGPQSVAIGATTLSESPPGDYNANGRVEQGDLDLVLLNWGESAEPELDGWLSQLPTGTVDQDELDLVLLHWGQ